MNPEISPFTHTLENWPASVSLIARVISRIAGLRCVDAGRLEMSRITESLTALLIGVNSRYKAHAGIRLTGLPDPDWE